MGSIVIKEGNNILVFMVRQNREALKISMNDLKKTLLLNFDLEGKMLMAFFLLHNLDKSDHV